MFKFRKVRGPEQIGEALVTLEESANRLENIVETAQKEKSRLHLLVGNVSERMAEIKKTAASFQNTADKIAEYDDALKNIQQEIDTVKSQAAVTGDIRSEVGDLLEQLNLFKAQLNSAREDLNVIQNTAGELTSIEEKVLKAKTDIEPQLEILANKQTGLTNKFNEMTSRLDQSESQLAHFADLSGEFEKTVDKISRESARITTWMAATEKMSSELARSNENLETTKQKIDHLHELAEYVELKTKALGKFKELLKNAHLEYGKANILLVEIKAKLAELEQDSRQLREIQANTNDIDKILKSFENRYQIIESKSEQLSRILDDFARVEIYAKNIEQKQRQLESLDRLTDQLSNQAESAHNDLRLLQQTSGHVDESLKCAEESQYKSRVIAQQMTELIGSAEGLLERIPDIKSILEEIESIRKRSLAVENKLLENMALAAELKEQSGSVDEIKQCVEGYRQESSKTMTNQKKELDNLGVAINGLKTNLESMRSQWLEMPDVLTKLAETEIRGNDLEKKYGTLAEHEKEAIHLKGLIEQNAETFGKFENTVTAVHQKASEMIKFKAELENIELRISTLDSGIKNLMVLSDKVAKVNAEMTALSEKVNGINGQIKDSQKQAENVANECEKMRHSQENIRLDAGEVMDLFSRLSDMRLLAEEKSKELANLFEQSQAKINQLNQMGEKAQNRTDEYRGGLSDLKDEINALGQMHQELVGKFAYLDKESNKIAGLAGQLRQRQLDITGINEKIVSVESRLKNITGLEEKLAEFEKTSEKHNAWLNKILEKASKISDIQEHFSQLNGHLGELETRLADISVRATEADRLYKQFSKMSLMAEELKARERNLADDERLVNRAIDAAASLEELIRKAELLARKGGPGNFLGV